MRRLGASVGSLDGTLVVIRRAILAAGRRVRHTLLFTTTIICPTNRPTEIFIGRFARLDQQFRLRRAIQPFHCATEPLPGKTSIVAPLL